MFYKKLNNADLWDKIQKLREIIKKDSDFKTRGCWKCEKDLNIYDFLSDNVEFPLEYIIKLWQSPILEYHCCDCFKSLKIDEIEEIERNLKSRTCGFCQRSINLREYGKINNYLKINELRDVWFNLGSSVFCSKICRMKYFRNKKSTTVKT